MIINVVLMGFRFLVSFVRFVVDLDPCCFSKIFFLFESDVTVMKCFGFWFLI